MTSCVTTKLHIDISTSRSHRTFYALRILKQHGLSGPKLWEVANATLISRLTYASQAWWGLVGAEGKSRLQAVINKAVKLGYLPNTQQTIEHICNQADAALFSSVVHNSSHVLYHLLPPIKSTSYNLRSRPHNHIIPSVKDTFFKKTFIIRMLSLDSF